MLTIKSIEDKLHTAIDLSLRANGADTDVDFLTAEDYSKAKEILFDLATATVSSLSTSTTLCGREGGERWEVSVTYRD